MKLTTDHPKGYNSMFFSAFIKLCNHHLQFQNIPSLQKKAPSPSAVTPPPPQPLTIRNHSLCMDRPVLDVFRQWNHTLCVLLCLLLSLSIVFSGSIHVVERFLHPFSWLRDAPGCGGTTFVYPSSVDGHLGCFYSGCYESCCCEHVSSCECVCVCVSFPLDIYLGLELLNHKVIFFLTF